MDQHLTLPPRLTTTRKRRRTGDDTRCRPPTPTTSLDELNQDLLERVLSRLPPSSFFRLRAVCKRWNSVATSPAFQLACSQVPAREPWFLMAGPELRRPVVFDSSQGGWKKNLNYPPPSLLRHTHRDLDKPTPVASTGGLVCFRAFNGELVVCNPVTGTCRQLPPAPRTSTALSQTIHAIAMSSHPRDSSRSYKLVTVSGDFPCLTVQVYHSSTDLWEEIVISQRPTTDHSAESGGDHDTVYFLSKTGDVVATNMQRSPSKQYSAVMTVEGGEETICFLSPSGTIVSCNLKRGTFFEHPRVLPAYAEHSLDIVECGGEMLVVLLSDFLDSASLRVWRFSAVDDDRSWHQVAAMPPALSHGLYGRKADVNCVGCGDAIFACVSSAEYSGCFVCDLVAGEWSELPVCVSDGKADEFVSAFSFEPRIEARV